MPHIAFFSYAHADDVHSAGKLVKFCQWLETDIHALIGDSTFKIFLDRDSIEWGQRWKRVIDGGLDESAFLIPVISPRYLKRPECRREFLEFHKKEQSILGGRFADGCDGLILPLRYLELPPDSDDEISLEVTARHWTDIEQLSNQGSRLISKSNSDLIRRTATRLVALLNNVAPTLARGGSDVSGSGQMLDTLVASFERASAPLLMWPATMPNGDWLERRELSQLLGACNSSPTSAHVIVGSAGAGKSALLAKLAHQCRTVGHAVLGIKADFLPATLATDGELSAYVLKKHGDLAEAVLRLAASRPVIVIIDQLDALADLVDLKSARLDLLLNLIQALRGQNNVHLYCSSRTYELHHDLRLNALTAEGNRPGLAVVELQPLSREQISSQLTSTGINGDQWPESYFEFLAIPYHLRAFLQYVAHDAESGSTVPEQSVFASIHSIHELHWAQSVVYARNSRQCVGVLERLTERISDTEALRQPVSLFDEFGSALTDLEQAGWLHVQDSSVGFAHQTQYEFLLARTFALNSDGFINYVLEREHGLFVRPRVWHTLQYARNASPQGYLRMLGGLLASTTRRHLKMLLIDFLGQIADPTEQEVIWVTELLNNPATYALVAVRLWKQQGWYEALSPHVLPALMGQPAEQCWPVARILEYAWPFAFDRNRALLRDQWAYRVEQAHLLWTVVVDSPSFDDESVEWLCWVASKVDIAPWALRQAAESIAKTLPESAPQILAAGLNRRLDAKLAEDDPTPPPLSGDPNDAEWIVQRATYRRRARISAELDGNQWHDIDNIAKHAPNGFLRELWPWFCRALEHCDEWHKCRLDMFRDEQWHDRWFDSEFGNHYPLPQALLIAVQELAKADPGAFAQFVEQNTTRDSMAVQRLLACGLIECASTRPALCLHFLTSDDRRFFLGTCQDDMSATRRLLRAASPHWTDEQLIDVQRAVLKWNPYRAGEEIGQDEGAFILKYRAQLLRTLPTEGLLSDSVGVVAVHEASLQARERESAIHRRVHVINSPVDAIGMETMSDSEIVALFDYLHDSTGAYHPDNWHFGGSEQASHEFREFAKVHPARVAEVIRQFRPGVHERPAGYGLLALAGVKYDSATICSVVRELDQKGFSKPEFRDDVAQALHDVAIADRGLPNDLCQLLSQWLLKDDIPETVPDDDRKPKEEAEQPRSVLWDHQRYNIPHRWYWIGAALKLGLSLSDPPRNEEWLSILVRCADRPFPREVWTAWLWDFTSYYVPDRAAVAPTIADVLIRRPDILASDAGISALIHFSNWLDKETRHEVRVRLHDSTWSLSQQAEGEIVGVWALRDDDEQCWELIETWLSTSPEDSGSDSFRVGLAFAAANMWTDSSYRAAACSLLCRLSTIRSRAVAEAILHAFRRDGCLRADLSTHEFLKTLGQHFDFALVGQRYWVSKRLIEFLPHEPELILRICQRIVTTAKLSATNSETRFGPSISHLVAIALTLHRNPDPTLRTEGLTLFEDLLELDAYGTSQALTELDQRPIPTRRRVVE